MSTLLTLCLVPVSIHTLPGPKLGLVGASHETGPCAWTRSRHSRSQTSTRRRYRTLVVGMDNEMGSRDEGVTELEPRKQVGKGGDRKKDSKDGVYQTSFRGGGPSERVGKSRVISEGKCVPLENP